MKVLVTGSSGLVGSALAPFLEKNQHEVYKLVRERTDLREREADQVAFTPTALR